MIKGPRICLRQWTDDDLDPFAEMDADPEVMRFLPKVATREESSQFLENCRNYIEKNEWGLWVVEIDDTFAGITGCRKVSFQAHFTPAIEIGWRLRKEFWGHGYATEAARVAMLHGFLNYDWSEIVSYPTSQNKPSWRVMQRLGMSHDEADDFYHPKIPKGHPLQLHCLYKLKSSPSLVEELRKNLKKEN